jgi:hypothetical protein
MWLAQVAYLDEFGWLTGQGAACATSTIVSRHAAVA